ncbi:UNKNOWN [Stylonychia lemnae]|uniref:Uncharacterized protein n=1 Tax=Stylonychia lemnae TaxID=5949 RepID=A0A078AW77_STYLE|nr:UNKNOWN [Stylonychia lemnae]|eukprot:CDW86389.1 UNKNOWN [Stylonychia lemnae]
MNIQQIKYIEQDNILYLLKDFSQTYSILKNYENLFPDEVKTHIISENIYIDFKSQCYDNLQLEHQGNNQYQDEFKHAFSHQSNKVASNNEQKVCVQTELQDFDVEYEDDSNNNDFYEEEDEGFYIVKREEIAGLIEQERQKLKSQIKVEPLFTYQPDDSDLNKQEILIQNKKFYQKYLRFIRHCEQQLDILLSQFEILQPRISMFAKKSEKIVNQKVQQQQCNFSAIKHYFITLKKEYDQWFFILIDIFQGIEEIVMALEKLQWGIKDELVSLKKEDEKCRWGIYSSAIITLMGMPVSGYSVALAIGTGSFQYKRHQISQKMQLLMQYHEVNDKNLRIIREKEDIIRKIIDVQVQNVKVGIDLMFESASKKRFGTYEQTINLLKLLQKDDHLNSSYYMCITVMDAMSLNTLNDDYIK